MAGLSPLSLMLGILALVGLAHGCAWYWDEFRGWELTPQLMEFSLVLTIFYTVMDIIFGVIKKYARRKTLGIENQKARKKKRDNIEMLLFFLTVVIVIAIGYIVLKVNNNL